MNQVTDEIPTEERVPLVSVVIPTFNRLPYLKHSIGSVLKQTITDIEVIVQDNGSNENPASIVESFGDPRVRFYRNPTNVGPTRNIMSVCLRARGKYLAILGDDDAWQPDFLEKMVTPLEQRPDVIVSFCPHDYIDPEGKIDERRTRAINRRHRGGLRQGFYKNIVRIALVNRAICAFSAAVYRRDAVPWDRVPLDLAFGVDNYINYLAARTGMGCYYYPHRLAQLRLFPQSLSFWVKASVDGRELNGRSCAWYWDAFYRDRAVSEGHPYFAMKRNDNALRIVMCAWHKRGWRGVLQESHGLAKKGYLKPQALLYHLRYGWH